MAIGLFVAVIDPWNVLPFSPPLPRVPISTNARYSMPALAASPRFDSAVIGSSSSRLLRPAVLDGLFGGHFVNLAMNAADATEQARMLALFVRTHPDARRVILGLDSNWCTEVFVPSGRPFPAWMYAGPRWAGYREILSWYAVQEAAVQLWTMLGFKRPRYGPDGYTNFLPPEPSYDPARVDAAFARWAPVPVQPARADPASYVLPMLPLLRDALAALPPATRVLLFTTPAQLVQQGQPGSDVAGMLAECKRRVAAIPGVRLVDFLRPSAITRDRANYWDPVHYRVPVADRLMADLAAADRGEPGPDYAIIGR